MLKRKKEGLETGGQLFRKSPELISNLWLR